MLVPDVMIPELAVRREAPTRLVVVLHAFMSTGCDMASVTAEIAKAYPEADIYSPTLPCGAMSTYTPEELAERVKKDIAALWNETSYKDVVLVGHSLGALLVRQAYVLARDSRGENSCWSKHVERIILLAGMNRGWDAGHHLGFWKNIWFSIGILFASLLEFITCKSWLSKVLPCKRLLIMSIRRGTPFITQLRVRWIQMCNREDPPLTIQLLGTVDDLVAPTDNIDIVAGRHFVYLDVPYSGHEDVREMASCESVNTRDHGPTTKGALRRAVFHAALTEDESELSKRQVIPSDTPPPEADLGVSQVIFVIHGIRDHGFWTQRIARKVLERSAQDHPKVKLATETSSYGYFPMLPFLLPGKRDQKVAWFMDQYAETLAQYPNAHKISFVGHSNGTYLLGRALQLYPFCKFENVVLAGSVLSSEYNWENMVKAGQVKRILNFVASGDWVVAFFPKTIELLKMQDLGSGGHDGFHCLSRYNLRYVQGSHSAALAEDNWDTIADFVLNEGLPEIPLPLKADGQNFWIKWIGRVAWIVWIVLALVIYLFGWVIWNSGAGEAERTLMLVFYGVSLWWVVTKL